jgi:predicted esterase
MPIESHTFRRSGHTRTPFGLGEPALVRLAAAVVSRVNPFMTWADARTVRRVVADRLAEMEQYADYRTLPPAWPEAVRAVAGRDYSLRHLYLYIPPQPPAGLLVSLHGHGPNAALLVHVWRPFADRHRLAVVAPSFGYGNWEHPAAAGVVRAAADFARHRFGLGPSPAYLAGLSQGGCGVFRAADGFDGLIGLSPTLEPAVLAGRGWAGRRVIVLHGGRDVNVRPHTVDRGVALLRAGGADVTYHTDPAADHFRFFAGRDDVFARLTDWLAGG